MSVACSCLADTDSSLLDSIVFNTTIDDVFVSSFEERGSMACVEIVGGGFGNERIAGDKGEFINALVCSLLTTVLFVGRFVDGITSS